MGTRPRVEMVQRAGDDGGAAADNGGLGSLSAEMTFKVGTNDASQPPSEHGPAAREDTGGGRVGREWTGDVGHLQRGQIM